MVSNSNRTDVVILGAGGHAKSVIEATNAGNTYNIRGLTTHKNYNGPSKVLDCPVLGDDSCLPELVCNGLQKFIVGIGSVGDNSARKRLFDLGVSQNLTPAAILHPAAIVSGSANIEPGTVVLGGAIIGADCLIGNNVIINHGAIVEHDCKIGNHVHISTGACLAGAVNIGEAAHIGAGATIIQGITIGSNAVVAAGAVVVSDVAADMTVRGVPAR